jgi:hypothetical protein
MMEIFSKYKNIVLVVVIAVVVFSAYSFFFGGDVSVSDSMLSSDAIGDKQSAIVGKEFLTTLLELRSLKLDESLFSDRAFTSLKDFSQELSPQPSGRPNPFAPIGVDVVVSGNAGSNNATSTGAR